MSDFEILKELETQLNIKIPKISFATDYKSHYSICNNEKDEFYGRIVSLKITNCTIKDFALIKNLKTLRDLDLEGNELNNIIGLSELYHLQFLNLSRNKIINISELSTLKKLRRIILRDNKISSIDGLAHLDASATIDLQYNKIKYLPSWAAYYRIKYDTHPYDSAINLYGNSLIDPPPEIIFRGREAIIDWYQNGKRIPINEAKVLLVGHGDVGKTTLVKCLRGEKPIIGEIATDQIQITSHSVKNRNKKIKLNFWDFGGQEIMHSTHQFFLTKRSIYLLVLDGRRDEDPEYWLKHIESFGGDSPILIVMNKIDDNPTYDVNRQFLLEKYPCIIGFYKTECIKRIHGIDELKQGLITALNKVKITTTPWPKNWFEVKKTIENTHEDIISQDKYETICEQNDILDEDSKNSLADYLNDLGAVVHFNDSKINHLHILQPRWVSAAAYKIINSEVVSNNKGEFNDELLISILRKGSGEPHEYKPYTHGYIIELMKKFELCYHISNNNYLIPELLSIQQPKLPKQTGPVLRFYFQYDTLLPRSIIPRFIVRMNSDIKDNLRWRTGVVLTLPIFNSLAIVIVDKQEKRIHITVSGKERSNHLSIIRKEFHDLNKTFEKLTVTEWIPLPGEVNRAVEYEELKGYENNNKQTYFSGILQKSYNVKELLDGIDTRENLLNKKYAFDVFISYSSKDKNIIDSITQDFENKELSFWRDENNIQFGDSLITEISRGIDNSRILLLCFSENQKNSFWSNEEWKVFMTKMLSGKSEQTMITLILDESSNEDLPTFLRGRRNAYYRNTQNYMELLSFLSRKNW